MEVEHLSRVSTVLVFLYCVSITVVSVEILNDRSHLLLSKVVQRYSVVQHTGAKVHGAHQDG